MLKYVYMFFEKKLLKGGISWLINYHTCRKTARAERYPPKTTAAALGRVAEVGSWLHL